MAVKTHIEKLTEQESGDKGGMQWPAVIVTESRAATAIRFDLSTDGILRISTDHDEIELSWREWDAVVTQIAAARRKARA